MTSDPNLDIRPRSTGELLDDATRLCLSDAPILLALCGLFLVPVAVALLLLFALPVAVSPWLSPALPAVAAFLLPLCGLASGACQELFRRRASDMPESLRVCLRGAMRRGAGHTAAAAVGGLFALPAACCSAWWVVGW